MQAGVHIHTAFAVHILKNLSSFSSDTSKYIFILPLWNSEFLEDICRFSLLWFQNISSRSLKNEKLQEICIARYHMTRNQKDKINKQIKDLKENEISEEKGIDLLEEWKKD